MTRKTTTIDATNNESCLSSSFAKKTTNFMNTSYNSSEHTNLTAINNQSSSFHGELKNNRNNIEEEKNHW